MVDTRPRALLNGKKVRLDQLAAEVGSALSASDLEVVVADGAAKVTADQLRAAVEQHTPQPRPQPAALTAPAGTAAESVPSVMPDGSVVWRVPPPPGARVDHWVTGNASELVASLPMNPSAFQVAYSLPVPDIRSGDVIVVLAELEATNPYGRDPWDDKWNAMLTGWVLLADSPTATTGIEITENNGFNIDPNMHHGTLTKVGSVRPVGTDLGDKHVNVVLRAASSRAAVGDALILDQDYGRLTVLRFRS